jgi:hypothetical protein
MHDACRLAEHLKIFVNATDLPPDYERFVEAINDVLQPVKTWIDEAFGPTAFNGGDGSIQSIERPSRSILFIQNQLAVGSYLSRSYYSDFSARNDDEQHLSNNIYGLSKAVSIAFDWLTERFLENHVYEADQ